MSSNEHNEESQEIEDLIEDIKDDVVSKIPEKESERRLLARKLSVTKSSILPDPEDVRKLEEVVPGAGDRILKLTEDQVKHRHEMEKNEQKLQHKNNTSLTSKGMNVSVVMALISGVVAITTLLQGSQVTGIIFALTAVMPLIINSVSDIVGMFRNDKK